MQGRAGMKLSTPPGAPAWRPGHPQLGPAVPFPLAPHMGHPASSSLEGMALGRLQNASVWRSLRTLGSGEPCDLSWVSCAAGGAGNRVDPYLVRLPALSAHLPGSRCAHGGAFVELLVSGDCGPLRT